MTLPPAATACATGASVAATMHAALDTPQPHSTSPIPITPFHAARVSPPPHVAGTTRRLGYSGHVGISRDVSRTGCAAHHGDRDRYCTRACYNTEAILHVQSCTGAIRAAYAHRGTAICAYKASIVVVDDTNAKGALQCTSHFFQ
eukprot:IDg1555t1